MNKYFILSLILMLSSFAQAGEIHVFLPTSQYRYENDKDQLVTNHRYSNYNLAAIIYEDYLLGAEFNEYQQDSTSGSIRIGESLQEFNLYAGYFVYSHLLSEEYKVIFDLGPTGYIGQSRSTVETQVGNASQKSIGENNVVYGVGMQATLRVSFMLLQPEVRYMYSRLNQPSWVPVYGARLGFRIGF